MLDAKRYADNGDAEQKTEKQVRQAKPKAKRKDPDDIAKQTQSAKLASFYIPAKRPEDKSSDFKALQAKRNADNRQANQNPAERPEK